MTSKMTASRLSTQKFLDEYLQLRGRMAHITPELIEVFAAGQIDIVRRVAAGLSKSFPDHPDLPLLHFTAHEMAQRSGGEAKVPSGPGKGRAPRISIPLDDVPPEFIERIRSSGHGTRIKADLIVALREVLGAARRAGLPEVPDFAAMSACRIELASRVICDKTVARKIRDFSRLGELWGLDPDAMTRIANERRAALKRADIEPAIRHAAFRSAPLSPLDYARIAHITAEEAYACKGGRQSTHMLFLTAAVLAFLSFLPERISDILGIVVGQDITRDARGWSSQYFSAKTNVDRSTEYLPDQLTPYLDDLILFGADPGPQGSHLAHLYRLRVSMKSPLFVRTDLRTAYSKNRVFELVQKRTGHGPHAARKAMTDYQAEVGGSIQDVMDLLGHRRASTSINSYEVRAKAIRRGKTSQALEGLRADLTAAEEVRLPDGRKFDLGKICRELEKTNP